MLLARIIGSAALSLLLLIGKSEAKSAFLPPTATEIFHLRSECAALAGKILNSSIIGPALYKSQISHYDPLTNRCYVEITIQSADTTRPPHDLSQYLYDGQTGEMLAAAQIEEGKRWGMVYDWKHQTTTLTNAGWDDAIRYINTMMADDRK